VSLPKLQTGLVKLEAQLAEMRSEVKRIGEQIRSNRGESNTRFESAGQDQQAKHTAVKADLGSMRGELNSMRTETSAKLNSLEKRLMGLEESLKSLEKSLK
jgi:chromosome segregation ATPase